MAAMTDTEQQWLLRRPWTGLENVIRPGFAREAESLHHSGRCLSLGMFVLDLFKSRCRLEAEKMFLRHQLSVALRRAPPRLRLRGSDRALLVWITRLWPGLIDA